MSVAISYAKALYQAARESDGSGAALDQLESQLDAFATALKDPFLHKAILGPVVPHKDKEALIELVAQKAGFSRLLKNFLLILNNKGRLPVFVSVREAFSAVRLEAEGGVEGRLVAADPMSDADVASLAQAFGRKLGKKVAFRSSTDPNLLAGMKVTVNGVTYDGSLRSQLQQLRERLLAGTHAI